MSILIRPGELKDISAVHQLVVELATFVGAAEEVVATVDRYKKDFNEGLFQLLVAEDQGKVIGMALYFNNYSTWKGKIMYLEDFVVLPDYRQQGIGQMLFDALIKVSEKEGCVLLKWQVLDTNQVGIQFYNKNEAILEDNWITCKLFLNPEN